MTPTETAERIASAHMHRDNPLYESLASAITTAIQAASDAQLNRDRAVIEATKKAARIHRDAWDHIDGQRCVMLQKIGDYQEQMMRHRNHQAFLSNELKKFSGAMEWMDKNRWDCIWTTTLQQPRWVIGNRVTGDEIAEGKTMHEAICNARAALEGEGWRW